MQRRLLVFDGAAGATVGVVMLGASTLLAPFFGLPPAVLAATAIANIAYGTFSLSLARVPVPPRVCLKALVTANFAWTFVCVGIAARYAGPGSWLGVSYILLEGLFVGVLAAVEMRVFGLVGAHPPQGRCDSPQDGTP